MKKPLDDTEQTTLLRYLLRTVNTTSFVGVKRLAKALYDLLNKIRYN